METYKTGDKVLLYSLEECKLQHWHSKDINRYDEKGNEFSVVIADGFLKFTVNSIVDNMINNLGSVQIIKTIYPLNFFILGSSYSWPYQLIKKIL